MNNLTKSRMYKEFQQKREDRVWNKISYFIGTLAIMYFGVQLLAYLILK